MILIFINELIIYFLYIKVLSIFAFFKFFLLKFIFRIKPKVAGTTTVTDVVKKKVKGADGILRERVQIMNRRYDVDKNGKIIK